MSQSSRQQSERSIILWLIGVLAFNFPLLSLVADSSAGWHIPGLVIYLFGTWLAFILLIYWLVDHPQGRQSGSERRRS